MSSPIQLPPPPYQTPPLNAQGMWTEAWQKWFQQLYNRVGGALALSNPQISSSAPSFSLAPYVPSTQTTLYTVPIGQTAIVDSFTVSNTDINQRSVSIYAVPYNSTASNTNLIQTLSLAPKTTQTISAFKSFVLTSGSFISGIASADNVVLASVNGKLVA